RSTTGGPSPAASRCRRPDGPSKTRRSMGTPTRGSRRSTAASASARSVVSMAAPARGTRGSCQRPKSLAPAAQGRPLGRFYAAPGRARSGLGGEWGWRGLSLRRLRARAAMLGPEGADQEEQVAGPLGEAARQVGIPRAAVGNVDAHAVARAHERLLEITAHAVEHL